MGVITGGCLCGAVRFSSAPPLMARACWCRACQVLSSGNASINVLVTAEDLSVHGETSRYTRMADSGARIEHRFCATCGTPLFARDLDEPRFLMIRAGALDDREQAKPETTIWCKSAPSWGLVDIGAPRFGTHVEASGS